MLPDIVRHSNPNKFHQYLLSLTVLGNESEVMLLERMNGEWTAYEGSWNPVTREFLARQACFRCLQSDGAENVLCENGEHKWLQNQMMKKDPTELVQEAQWQGSLRCESRDVTTIES